MSYDINKIRQEFPILNRKVYGKPLVYFDNGATTQKPNSVISSINKVYKDINSNIHRGVHFLSAQSTDAYENARRVVKEFINAEHIHEIVFTSGTTASINLVAFSFGEKYISEGDEIIVSSMEHHSNIVPWQMLCERKNAKLKVIPFNEKGDLLIEEFKILLSEKTKLVAINHVSNTLGTINPVKEIINLAHKKNIPVLIDGAQAVQHITVNIQELDADFYAFSGHKIYGPTGIGVLYGKEKYLNTMPPYMGGGDMIKTVSFEKTTYNDLPFKFEAGTANYTGAIGLAEALNFVSSIGISNIRAHEKALLDYGTMKLSEIESLIIYGNSNNKTGAISFLLDNIHHSDVGMILDKMGVAVRTGNHCTQPVMDKFNITGTVRASFAMYNTKQEIDILFESLNKILEMFS
ncbi:MAG: cysteine desulfurase [Chlorobi bacterium]|nr:cysteine desulfurase [Chlorobiota bacterium]